MIYLSRQRPGSTLYIPFESFASSTGAPITISGFAVGDIKVWKDGSTTERASTSGYTLLDTDGIDFDGITGLHGFSIDLSDNSTANFWQCGARYIVGVSTITVDGQTMSFYAALFRIGYEASMLDTFIATLSSQTSFTLNTGPVEDNALTGCLVVLHNVASAVQQSTALISAYTGATKTVTLAAAPTFTIAAQDNISVFLPALQPTVAGARTVVQTGDAFVRLGAPVGTNISVDIAGIQSDTDNMQTRLPTVLVGGRMDSNMSAINNNNAAAVILDRSARTIVRGTISAASTTTVLVTSSLDPAATAIDQFKTRVLIFDKDTTTANLRGQVRDITTNTALGVVTTTAFTDAPVSGDTFVIV